MKYGILIIYFSFLFDISFAQEIPKKYRFMDDCIEGNLENTLNPVVFTDSARIYQWPDSTSKIFGYVKKGEIIRIIKQGYQTNSIQTDSGKIYKNKSWYKIESRFISGYVVSDDIARYSIHNYEKKYFYFIKTDEGDRFNPGNGITVYKYDEKSKIYIDTFHVDNMSGACVVKNVHEVKLKNADALFSIKRLWPFCGGGWRTVFVVDANDSLSELVTDFGSGEYISYSFSNVWLPVSFHESKVKFLYNGDVDASFDKFNGKIVEHEVPKNIHFPLDELIIIENETGEATTDENGIYMEKPDGEYDIIKTSSTEYYRWNGHQLQKVK